MWSFLQCLFYYCLAAVITSVNAKDNSFFTNVNLRDSVSGYAYCQDPDHWFIVEAQLFVSEGQDSDMFLSIPKEFTGLPTEPFELMHKSQAVGEVMISDDHLVQVSFPIPPKNNVTANLRFMAQLDTDVARSMEAPKIVNYNFYSSQGEHFKRLMRYEPRSLREVFVDRGMFWHNRTAWFVVNVPVEQLDEPIYVFSDPGAGSHINEHQIIQDMTRCELVTSVDSFHRPRVSEPIEPQEDYTSESSILMRFDHNLEGYYVRIWYYTKPRIVDSTDPVSVQTTFYKRAVKGLGKYAIYS
ncbi:hypothetical protein ZYGR_0AZ00310 [Zygosaccharomyces rouxii]|uniref:Uncharacterized protein n=1 Tax=Zygosaccharomyces rouxii TaxID=4956 RepID=A0A1Q3AJP1_ZYGRO|nr:hypothetical protein ZYGR_0AZ00310 [Zygosaccharomyces rouxii]